MRSDIFNEYARIAEEKGLVKLSADEDTSSQPKLPKESPKLKKYKKSPYPRAGSDDISTIEALYGVKPNNSVEYENNIMEAAHKTPVVIAPAYDRLNALVENNIERQNIIHNIVMKPTDSITSYHRYAEKELLMQLVRVANEMDNADNDELRLLADTCIAELKKNAQEKHWYDGLWDKAKEIGGDIFGTGEGASTGAAIGGIAGGIIGCFFLSPWAGAKIGAFLGGATGGIVASLAKTAPHVVDVATNAKDAVTQMDDLKNKIQSAGDASAEVEFFDGFQKQLAQLGKSADQYNYLISKMQSDPNAHPADDTAAVVTTFMNTDKAVRQYMGEFDKRVGRGIYNRYVEQSKALTPLFHMIDNDLEDVQKSLASLKQAMDSFEKAVGAVKQEAAPVVEQAQQSGGQSLTPASQKTEAPGAPEEDEDYAAIMQLLHRKPTAKEVAFIKSQLVDNQ